MRALAFVCMLTSTSADDTDTCGVGRELVDNACVTCTSGRYATATSDCQSCPQGTISSAGGASQCTLCSAGFIPNGGGGAEECDDPSCDDPSCDEKVCQGGCDKSCDAGIFSTSGCDQGCDEDCTTSEGCDFSQAPVCNSEGCDQCIRRICQWDCDYDEDCDSSASLLNTSLALGRQAKVCFPISHRQAICKTQLVWCSLDIDVLHVHL